MAAAVKEMESKVEDTSTFTALPQEEQQELEQTLSQNSQLLALNPCPEGHKDWQAMVWISGSIVPSSLRPTQRLSPCQGRYTLMYTP